MNTFVNLIYPVLFLLAASLVCYVFISIGGWLGLLPTAGVLGIALMLYNALKEEQ